MLRLEADPAQPQRLEALRYECPQAMGWPRSNQGEAGRFGFHLDPVAAIAKDFRRRGADHQEPEAAAEAGQITDVLSAGDDQAVYLQIEQAPAEGGKPAGRVVSSHPGSRYGA